jgi:hypothetical protein
MANQVSGRVIAVSKLQTVASADPSKAPLKKREIYIDCTRFDPYTGERSQYENKPLLEFAGDKVLDKVSPVLDQLQKDDIVTISFELVGRSYQGNDGKKKFMTGIRCYDIALTRKAGGGQQYFDNHQVTAPAPQPAPQPEPAPMAEAPFPQPGQDGDDGMPF